MMDAKDKSWAKVNILVVDDLQDNIDVIARRLRNRDAQVYEASDGHEALDVLSVSPVDIILLDVMMPGLSGVDLVRRIRSKRCASALPIIMVSARNDQAIMLECLQAGANDYVTKPVDFQMLCARIETHLGIRETYRAVLRDRAKQVNMAEETRLRLAEAEAQLANLALKR
ncbi:transcriptional regulatory protein WalR [Candidatus Phycosocius bacilliformis]|uniref:Transcriptional regulatory protein WalR n=1 Tax=Candidatus Phycosocius bacilliformis TaxID=1445552 RepID=A0A2P2E6V3_9PROT|nr:response regulator [Candidatus Phycosocius bacilliformis]GBF56779.1 transcriptional regulatory protein WalR [Candidatus Phycosocius bacilliformis]